MTTDCTGCAIGLDHCHGTLVTHSDGHVECTDPQCPDADRPRHALIIDCLNLAGGCTCSARRARQLLRVS